MILLVVVALSCVVTVAAAERPSVASHGPILAASAGDDAVRQPALTLQSRLDVLSELGRRRLAERFIPPPPGSTSVDLVDDDLRVALMAHRLPSAEQVYDFFECGVPHAKLAEFRRQFPMAEPNAGRGRIRCDRERDTLVIIPRDTSRKVLVEMLETGYIARIAGSHWE